jgi:hypothetical protein
MRTNRGAHESQYPVLSCAQQCNMIKGSGNNSPLSQEQPRSYTSAPASVATSGNAELFEYLSTYGCDASPLRSAATRRHPVPSRLPLGIRRDGFSSPAFECPPPSASCWLSTVHDLRKYKPGLDRLLELRAQPPASQAARRRPRRGPHVAGPGKRAARAPALMTRWPQTAAASGDDHSSQRRAANFFCRPAAAASSACDCIPSLASFGDSEHQKRTCCRPSCLEIHVCIPVRRSLMVLYHYTADDKSEPENNKFTCLDAFSVARSFTRHNKLTRRSLERGHGYER